MKASLKPKVSAWLRLVAFMAIIVFTLVVFTILLSACTDPSGSGSGNNQVPVISTPGSVPRYVASSYTGSNNDRIKYSYTYSGYDFFYIYLGTLKGIPMFFKDAMYHPKGAKETYTFSREKIDESEIRKTVSQSSQTTRSVTNENTRSKTSGQQVGTELSQLFGASYFDLLKAETTFKISGEFSWSQITSETVVNSYQQSNELTNTVEEATKRTISSIETYTRDLTDDPAGYYRYTFFTASDVYLYVIRDSESKKVKYYEYREYKTNSDFWQLDYSETADFKKSDATSFEIDTSFLSNLPPAETVTVTFDKNNTDKGSTEANPQAKLVNLKASVGVLPAPPTRPGYTFVGWNTAADGKGTDFTPTTSITGSMTVYAKWIDLTTYTLAVNINPKDSGTVTPKSPISNISPGTAITIKVEPEKGYKFTKWEVVKGTVTLGNANNEETTVALKSDATIRANFQPNITLTVDRNIVAGGTISLTSKSGIAPGEVVNISATPNSGYTFKNWEVVKGVKADADFTSATNRVTTVTLHGDVTIRANFELITYKLTFERYPTSWGTIVQDNDNYPANTSITIEARPTTGNRFVCWAEMGGGGKAKFGNSKSRITTVTLSGEATIRAYFLPNDAIYDEGKGEIGKFSLNVPVGALIVAKLHIKYRDTGGSEKDTGDMSGRIHVAESYTADPDNKGILDGSWVYLYSEVVDTQTKYWKQAPEYFIYKKGSSKTASYTHSGSALFNNLTFNGVK